jgi:hypothetical protein
LFEQLRASKATYSTGDVDSIELLVQAREQSNFGLDPSNSIIISTNGEGNCGETQSNATLCSNNIAQTEDANVAAFLRAKADNSRVSIKELSKKLRDAAGKKGKAQIVKDIILEAGEQFPGVSFRRLICGKPTRSTCPDLGSTLLMESGSWSN